MRSLAQIEEELLALQKHAREQRGLTGPESRIENLLSELLEVRGALGSFDQGVWFQAAASGLWYRDRNAAGTIIAVRVDGVRFEASWVYSAQAKSQNEEGG